MGHRKTKNRNPVKKEPPAISQDEWLSELFGVREKNIPPNSFTAREIADKVGVGERQIRKLAQELIRKGRLKVSRVLIDGKILNYYHN
jgi:predicted transcriptional regulator of viral defense system